MWRMKTKCHKSRFVHSACILILLIANVEVLAQGNLVLNGSFEDRGNGLPPPFWTGNFGLWLGPIWGAADGRNHADISHPSLFAAQTLNTVPGQLYRVSFAVSGNPSFPGVSIVQMSWGGMVAGNTTWVSPNNWTYGNFDLVATSSSTVLQFQRNPASTSAGSFFDDVRVVAVPEPSALALLALCIPVLLAKRKRII